MLPTAAALDGNRGWAALCIRVYCTTAGERAAYGGYKKRPHEEGRDGSYVRGFGVFVPHREGQILAVVVQEDPTDHS